MATQEQIDYVFSNIIEAQPSELFRLIDGAREGIGRVLSLLEESALTAGEISEKTGVSTARVAVLLRKLVKKDYVTKSTDEHDARVTVVTLTDSGRSAISAMRAEMRSHIAMLIDELGADKLDEFIKLANEIKSVADEKIKTDF